MRVKCEIEIDEYKSFGNRIYLPKEIIEKLEKKISFIICFRIHQKEDIVIE